MKQLGLGFMQDVQDYDERYPQQNMGYLTPQGVWASWDVVIQPYVKSLQVTQCPSDALSVRVNSPLYGAGAHRSYSIPANFDGTNWETFRSLSTIPRPAETIMLAERTRGGGNGTDQWFWYSEMENLGPQVCINNNGNSQWVHLETSNFLFADGHVKARPGGAGKFPQFDGYTSYSATTGTQTENHHDIPR